MPEGAAARDHVASVTGANGISTSGRGRPESFKLD
jgi:hypothetical protein